MQIVDTSPACIPSWFVAPSSTHSPNAPHLFDHFNISHFGFAVRIQSAHCACSLIQFNRQSYDYDAIISVSVVPNFVNSFIALVRWSNTYSFNNFAYFFHSFIRIVCVLLTLKFEFNEWSEPHIHAKTIETWNWVRREGNTAISYLSMIKILKCHLRVIQFPARKIRNHIGSKN